MQTQILLTQREKDTINNTIDILKEYSRIYSASVLNNTGMYIDTAGSAANLLESLLQAQPTP